MRRSDLRITAHLHASGLATIYAGTHLPSGAAVAIKYYPRRVTGVVLIDWASSFRVDAVGDGIDAAAVAAASRGSAIAADPAFPWRPTITAVGLPATDLWGVGWLARQLLGVVAAVGKAAGGAAAAGSDSDCCSGKDGRVPTEVDGEGVIAAAGDNEGSGDDGAAVTIAAGRAFVAALLRPNPADRLGAGGWADGYAALIGHDFLSGGAEEARGRGTRVPNSAFGDG
ncbi:hypothetical protein MMPV_002694 [Pyropia vietnamensis]